MALTINPNSFENTSPRYKQGLPSPLPEISKKIPKLPRKEKGLGATHHVALGAVSKKELKLKEAFERAKKDAAEDGWTTSQCIQKYGITDPKMLFEIAKIAAASSGEGISRYIQKYGITDQKMLFEIAKIAAAENGARTSEFIKDYGITDEKMLFEIAKIAAANSGGVSRFIKNYRLTDQGMLFEIAKIAAASDGGGTSEFIDEYGITDQDMLFEIAKIAAAQNGGGTSEFIGKYDIKDQNMLFEIAKIAAAQNGSGISKFIKNYRLKDRKMLYAVAKIAAANNGGAVSRYIQNYGIKNQKMLYKIAKIAAANDGGETSEYIENYGLTDPKMLYKIAKIAAASDGAGTSENIENYGLTDQKMLFKIAKIAAANSGRGTSENIKNYHLTDQNMLYKIAKIAAAEDGGETSQYIQDYDLSNEQQLQVLQICLAQITHVALENTDFLTLGEFAENQIVSCKEKLFETCGQICAMKIPLKFTTTEEKQEVEKNLKEGFNQLKDFAIEFGASDKALAALEETIFTKHTSLLQQQKDLVWLVTWLMHYNLDPSEETLKQSPFSDEKLIPLLDCILKTIDSNLRNLATRALLAGYNDFQKMEVLKKLMEELGDDRLYLIVLFSTLAGTDKEITKQVCAELPKSKYKDAKQMAPINELMGTLYKSSFLSPEEKGRLLGLIFHPPVKGVNESKPDFSQRLDAYRKSRQNWISAVHTLLYFGQEKILINITTTTELVAEWKTFMGKTFCIEADLLDKFSPTFCNSKRCPNGLITYAARLQTLAQEERDRLMPLLGKFVCAVLDGTYPQVRYSFTDNLHLKTVFSGREELLKKWQTPLPIKIGSQESLEDHPEVDDGTFRTCSTILNPKAVMELQRLSPSVTDLEGIASILEISESFTIEDTDAWEDCAMMGTEVDNSCLNVHRAPGYNKCLVSPFCDGKIRLIVARENSSGKIIGRVVLRILWDTNNNPVLFVEKLYTKKGVNHRLIRQSILEGCKQKAQSLGVALTLSANDYTDFNAIKYPGALKALGGPAPYEYVDALGGIQKDGIYSIPTSYLLWSPSLH